MYKPDESNITDAAAASTWRKFTYSIFHCPYIFHNHSRIIFTPKSNCWITGQKFRQVVSKNVPSIFRDISEKKYLSGGLTELFAWLWPEFNPVNIPKWFLSRKGISFIFRRISCKTEVTGFDTPCISLMCDDKPVSSWFHVPPYVETQFQGQPFL